MTTPTRIAKGQPTIKDEIAKEVGQGFQKVSTTVGSSVRNVLGTEITGVMDDIKNIAAGAFSVVKGGFEWVTASAASMLGFGGDEDDGHDRAQVKYLGSIDKNIISLSQTQKSQKDAIDSLVQQGEDEAKRLARQTDKDGKSRLTVLGLLGVLMGMVAGTLSAMALGVLSYIMLPFQVVVNFSERLLVRVTRITGIIYNSIIGVFRFISNIFAGIGRIVGRLLPIRTLTRLLDVFERLRFFITYDIGRPLIRLSNTVRAVFGSVLSVFRTVFRTISNVVNVFSNIAAWGARMSSQAGPVVGFIANFVRMFGRIIKFVPLIGQAIAVIMGIVDFFRGFMKAEGTLIERIKAGLIAAIYGFFEPVFKAFDWISGLFGIETDAAGKAVEWITIGVNSVIDWIGGIADSFKELIGYIKEGDIKGILTSISNIVFDFFFRIPIIVTDALKSIFAGTFLEPVFGWVSEMFNNLRTTISNIIEDIFSPVMGIVNNIIKPFKKIIDGFKGKERDWIKIFSGIGEIVLNTIIGIGKFLIGIPITIVTHMIDFIKKSLSGLADRFGDVPILGSIIKMVQWSFDTISRPFTFILDGIKNLINWFKSDDDSSVISTILGGIKAAISMWWGVLTWPFRTVYNLFSNFTSEDGSNVISTILDGIKTVISMWWGVITAPFRLVYNLFDNFTSDDDSGIIQSLLNNIKSGISFVWNTITTPFQKAYEWITSLFDEETNFIGMFKSILTSVFNIPSKVIDWIKDALPSWSKVKEWISERLGDDGMSAMMDALSSVLEIPRRIVEWIKGMLPGWDQVKEWVWEKLPNFAQRGLRAVGLGVDDIVKDDNESQINKAFSNIQKMDNESLKNIIYLNSELLSLENQKYKMQKEVMNESAKINNQILEEMKKEVKNNRKNNDNMVKSINTSIINSQNVNSGQNRVMNESPDEIENFGMVFMNKTTLGSSL